MMRMGANCSNIIVRCPTSRMYNEKRRIEGQEEADVSIHPCIHSPTPSFRRPSEKRKNMTRQGCKGCGTEKVIDSTPKFAKK